MISLDGVQGELDAAGDAEFFEGAKEIIFDSVFAELETLGDLTVAETLRDQTRDLFFAMAERAGQRRVVEDVNGFDEGGQKMIDGFGIGPDLTLVDAGDAFAEGGEGIGAIEDAARAGAEGFDDGGFVGGIEQDDDGGFVGPNELLEEAESVGMVVEEAGADEQNVGAFALKELLGVLEILSGQGFELAGAGQAFGQELAGDGRGVRDHHTNSCGTLQKLNLKNGLSVPGRESTQSTVSWFEKARERSP